MRLSVYQSIIVLCLMTGGFAMAADHARVGYVSEITTERVVINGESFPLRNGKSNNMQVRFPKATECWVSDKARTTCGTIAGVGYIHKARVTLHNDTAARIEVIEMRQ